MVGKRVLVTGSGTGIGRGVALEFAREGAEIAVHYAHSEAGARTLVDQIRESGGQAEALQADFTEIEQVRRLASETTEVLGGLDVLVNNAGISMNMPFEETRVEQYDTLYDVNMRAMFFLTQALVPTMAEQGGGAVINVSSVHAYFGMNEYSAYAGTKAAIVAFTRVIALELIRKGIRVNAIAPGAIQDEKVLGDQREVERHSVGEQIPAGFVGNPRDVGRLAIFLASEESRYIVGQTILLDGGADLILPLTGDFRRRSEIQLGVGYVPGLTERAGGMG